MRRKRRWCKQREALINLKKWNKHEWLNQQFGTFLKKRNPLASSATRKSLEDHGREQQWMMAEFCFMKKNSSTTSSRVKDTLKEVVISITWPMHCYGMGMYVCQCNWIAGLINGVTADWSTTMNFEVYRAVSSGQIHPKAAKLIGGCFTVQMDNDLKHTAKAT